MVNLNANTVNVNEESYKTILLLQHNFIDYKDGQYFKK